MRFLRTICWMCALLGMLHVSTPARSQSPDTNTPSPGGTPVQAPAVAAAPVPDQAALKPAELDALVAPVALYPDVILRDLFRASAHPVQVVQASLWVHQVRDASGSLPPNGYNENWDPSVKALTAYPDLLQRLTTDPDWMSRLGSVYVTQPVDVLNAVQRVRLHSQPVRRSVSLF